MPSKKQQRRETAWDESDVDDGFLTVYVDGFPVSADLTEALPELSDDELLRLSERDREELLALFERERFVSSQRRTLQARIDFVHGQGASDATTVEQLEYLLAKERPLSDRRRALHVEIDRLRKEPT
jgi:hypothetical protein